MRGWIAGVLSAGLFLALAHDAFAQRRTGGRSGGGSFSGSRSSSSSSSRSSSSSSSSRSSSSYSSSSRSSSSNRSSSSGGSSSSRSWSGSSSSSSSRSSSSSSSGSSGYRSYSSSPSNKYYSHGSNTTTQYYSDGTSSTTTTYRDGTQSGTSTTYGGGTPQTTYYYGTSPSSRNSSSGSSGCLPVIAVVVIVVIIVCVKLMSSRSGGVPAQIYRPQTQGGGMDVSVIMLGIDWHARKQVQADCERISETADTSTNEGLALMLREVATVLRRVESSWLYAGAINRPPTLTPQVAERVFRIATEKAASRYQAEVVRNVEGQASKTAAEGIKAKSEEGPGVVVVTVAVAARCPLPQVLNLSDAGQIRRALETFSTMTEENIVATELIWSPAAEEDRMSTATLETLYPEMRKIDEKSVAGRVVCRYCAGYFAAELLSCPHCGGHI